MTLTDAYWKSADYLRVPVADLNKNALYSDGFLNMTNTFAGLSSFNKGNDPKVVMKAAYDNNKLYIYAEWIDSDINPSFAASMLLGPPDPLPTKSDSTGGWTAQGNSDKFAMAFDASGNATSSAGTFIDKGCAASCHNNQMRPASGLVDIWSWDLSNSDALGYAKDMVTDATSGLINDGGVGMTESNFKVLSNPRSGPAYEWDGTDQSVIRPDGKTLLIDPAYYILNKTPYLGDPTKGKKVYTHAAYGCAHCHGEDGGGTGPSGEATAFAAIGFARKYSRAGIKSFAANDLHTGVTYWAQVPAGSVDDLIAYIKGLGSIPGTYLHAPSGSCADVWSVSNVAKARINTVNPHTLYQVVFVRTLSNGNGDDIQFTSPEGKSYPFGIALMNGDSKNHIGSLKQILTFKPKQP